MNLSAYCNIPDLNEIAEKNGIHVARLRGYYLMSTVDHVSISEQRELAENNAKWCAERIFRKVKTGKYEVIEYSKRTERKTRKYIDKSKSG